MSGLAIALYLLAAGVACADTNPSSCSSWNTTSLESPSRRCDSGKGAVFDRLTELQAARIQSQEFDVLFLGDSILGSFNIDGSSFEGLDDALNFSCWYCDPDNLPAVFQSVVGRRHRAAVFAVGGDQSMHLLWRLRQGGLAAPRPSAVRVVVLHVGCNDVSTFRGSPNLRDAGAAVAARIAVVAQELLQMYARAHVLVVGILPRAAGMWMQPSDGPPPPPGFYQYPNPTFTPAIDAANVALGAAIPALAAGRAHFVDCSASFLDSEASESRREMMPDGVHPNAAGGFEFLTCIESRLQGLDAAPPRTEL